MNTSDLFFDNECLDMCVFAFWRRSRVFDMAAQAIIYIGNHSEQKGSGRMNVYVAEHVNIRLINRMRVVR